MGNEIDTRAQESDLIMSDRFRSTVSTIDERFGEGYAKSNAALIGIMLQAGAIDYATRMLSRRSGQHEANERYALDGLSDLCRLKMYGACKKVYCEENPNATPEEYDQALKLIIDALGI